MNPQTQKLIRRVFNQQLTLTRGTVDIPEIEHKLTVHHRYPTSQTVITKKPRENIKIHVPVGYELQLRSRYAQAENLYGHPND